MFFETVERLDQWIHYATKNLGSVTTGGAISGKHEKIYTLSVKILYLKLSSWNISYPTVYPTIMYDQFSSKYRRGNFAEIARRYLMFF